MNDTVKVEVPQSKNEPPSRFRWLRIIEYVGDAKFIASSILGRGVKGTRFFGRDNVINEALCGEVPFQLSPAMMEQLASPNIEPANDLLAIDAHLSNLYDTYMLRGNVRLPKYDQHIDYNEAAKRIEAMRAELQRLPDWPNSIAIPGKGGNATS